MLKKPVKAKAFVKAKAKTPAKVKSLSKTSPAKVLESVNAYVLFANCHKLLEGDLGKQKISKDMRPLFDAFHMVLAGGKVAELQIKGTYEASTVKRLDSLLNKAVAEANKMNRDGGTVRFG